MSMFKRCPIILLPQVRPTCEGLIQCHTEWKSCITPEDDYNHVGDLSFGKNSSDGVFAYWKPMALYVLSNNIKDIEDGDYVYVEANKSIWQFKRMPCPLPYWGNDINCKKVIASTDKSLDLPEPSKDFVIKFIKEYNNKNIITHVLVEYYPEDEDWSELNGAFTIPETLKVSLDNTITIRSVKNNYTENDVNNIVTNFLKFLAKDHDHKYNTTEDAWKDWSNKNLVNPF